jgi:hypothetical protein
MNQASLMMLDEWWRVSDELALWIANASEQLIERESVPRAGLRPPRRHTSASRWGRSTLTWSES